MTDQRILFMGTAQFAVPSLAKLLSLKKNIINVYSSPPKKANRGMELTDSPIISFAKSNGLDFSHPTNLHDESEVKKIKWSYAEFCCRYFSPSIRFIFLLYDK